jgi:kinase
VLPLFRSFLYCLAAGQRLRGSVVTELVELPVLRMLDLSHNGLAGTLDDKFKTLQTLHLQFNTMTGPIPDTFFNEDSVMSRLNIGGNQMNGTLPGDVGLASQMTGLYVFENDFEGTIPVLGNMPLVAFQGQRNRFSGMLPFDLFIGVWAETITEWWLFDNEMTGQLSQNLGLFPNLQDFRVSNNQFDGNIPTSIYSLGQLFRLELNDNFLTGTIDAAIGDLARLETLDLSGNAFTGIVPTEISDIDVLKSVKVQFNALEGTIPTGLCFLPSMELLEADCLPEENPPNQCACCTRCCDRLLEACEGFLVR